MEVTIIAIGSVIAIDSIEASPCYIVGMVSPNDLVVFSPMEKITISDFDLNNVIDIDTISIGPTGAFNKTKNKNINIRIHSVNINGDEVREKFIPHFP